MYICMCVYAYYVLNLWPSESARTEKRSCISLSFPSHINTRNEFWFSIGHQSSCGLIEIRMTYCTLSIYLSIDLSNLNPILSYFISVYFVVSCFILSHFLLSYLSLSYIHCICTLLILFYLILVNYFLPDPIYNYIYLILSYFSYHIYLSNYRSVDLSIYLSHYTTIHPYTYIYVYVYVYIYACMQACMHTCMHTYIHTYIHICIYTYTCSMYIYIYKHT